MNVLVTGDSLSNKSEISSKKIYHYYYYLLNDFASSEKCLSYASSYVHSQSGIKFAVVHTLDEILKILSTEDSTCTMAHTLLKKFAGY